MRSGDSGRKKSEVMEVFGWVVSRRRACTFRTSWTLPATCNMVVRTDSLYSRCREWTGIKMENGGSRGERKAVRWLSELRELWPGLMI